MSSDEKMSEARLAELERYSSEAGYHSVSQGMHLPENCNLCRYQNAIAEACREIRRAWREVEELNAELNQPQCHERAN